jgi:site-specific DNA-methyltransferase (adenine-specific)
MGNIEVHHGDCIEVMRTLPENSVEAIVTDPPYGLGFMGKAWDELPPGQEWAEECLRVLKPGGHMLAFGGTRTWHRLAVAVEDAGFEIRDSIAWMYGSGFPKHRAALKPAFEPVVMGRKPFKGSLTANETLYGAGALNIDATRIGVGRWPANVVLDETTAPLLDQQSGQAGAHGSNRGAGLVRGNIGPVGLQERSATTPPKDEGGASRFFYVAKAPTRERPVVDGVAHPTVKPLALMRWLVKLVTPPGGTVLEPFAGSGATVEACIFEGFHCIAIEREAEYLPLIQARIDRQDAA